MANSCDNHEWTRCLEQQPLNTDKREIRLLKLLNSKSDTDSPAFELVRRELPSGVEPGDQASPYYALSYVWGSPEETQAILVDGIPVRIRQNLWQFLQRLRDHILRVRRESKKPRFVATVLPYFSCQYLLLMIEES